MEVVPLVGLIEENQVNKSPSGSVAVNLGGLHATGEPSSLMVTDTVDPWEMTGGSLTASTTTVTVIVSVVLPSLT